MIKSKRGVTIIELAIVIGLFFLMIAVLAPFVHMAKVRASRIECANNLMRISLGLHSYAASHGGKFPATLGELYPGYVDSERVFDCPTSKATGTKDNPGYRYYPGLTESSGPKDILAEDADARRGKNVLRVDGSVEWISK